MNASKIVIYTAGLFQGIALVAFPAASTILTNPDIYHLSRTEYGSLFIPQCILSIAASALNPALSRRYGSKVVLGAGLIANIVSMALLAASALVAHNHMLAYWLLLIATSCLGIGFGLVVPAVNSIAVLLCPKQIDAVVLVLNALLGVGTALAPVFISLFVEAGFWWGLPCALAIAMLVLVALSLPVSIPGGKVDFISARSSPHRIPRAFIAFAAFALLYGIIETLNGNWVSIYMKEHLGASIKVQSLALTAFWGMVTVGRVLFALLSKMISEAKAFQVAPFIAMAALIIIALLPTGKEYEAVAAFGLSGFGCSILLPLIISFGSKQLSTMSGSVPGMLISFYLLGYGLAAFGVGPLEQLADMSLRTDYGVGAAIAFLLGLIAVYIIQRKNEAKAGEQRWTHQET